MTRSREHIRNDIENIYWNFCVAGQGYGDFRIIKKTTIKKKKSAEYEMCNLGHSVVHFHGCDPFAQAFCCGGGFYYFCRVEFRVGHVLTADFVHDRCLLHIDQETLTVTLIILRQKQSHCRNHSTPVGFCITQRESRALTHVFALNKFLSLTVTLSGPYL